MLCWENMLCAVMQHDFAFHKVDCFQLTACTKVFYSSHNLPITFLFIKDKLNLCPFIVTFYVIYLLVLCLSITYSSIIVVINILFPASRFLSLDKKESQLVLFLKSCNARCPEDFPVLFL